jgi:hypothetical protein
MARLLAVSWAVWLLGSLPSWSEPAITGKPLAPPALKAVKEVLAASGVQSATVTETERTPRDQVEVMYSNLEAHKIVNYGPEGKAVEKVYHAGKGNSMEADAIKQAMLTELKQQMPAAQAAGRLQHLFADRWVVDIAVSSIPVEKRDALLAACESHPQRARCFGPGKLDEASFHFEFKRD